MTPPKVLIKEYGSLRAVKGKEWNQSVAK